MGEIIIYCDGGCRGNAKDENIGGWGAVLEYNGHVKEMYAGERNTTNNIQELKGMVSALEAVKTTHIPVVVYSDSKYIVDNFNNSLRAWKKRGWRKSDNQIIKNLELWKKLDILTLSQSDIKLVWVKGHADNEGNNRADELANLAMDEVV